MKRITKAELIQQNEDLQGRITEYEDYLGEYRKEMEDKNREHNEIEDKNREHNEIEDKYRSRIAALEEGVTDFITYLFELEKIKGITDKRTREALLRELNARKPDLRDLLED